MDKIISALAPYILKFVGAAITKMVSKWVLHIKRKRLMKKLREVNENEKSTTDERAKAYEDYVNAGKL